MREHMNIYVCAFSLHSVTNISIVVEGLNIRVTKSFLNILTPFFLGLVWALKPVQSTVVENLKRLAQPVPCRQGNRSRHCTRVLLPCGTAAFGNLSAAGG